MTTTSLIETNVKGFPLKRGKVRDVYDIGKDKMGAEHLVIVTTDRISAFDFTLPTAIPRKGEVLTKLTSFWIDFLGTPNHAISTDLNLMPPEFRDKDLFGGRTMLVHKTNPIKFECVVRGFLCGSGWGDYAKTQAVCGINMPKGLKQNCPLPQCIFTPATKEDEGHDINISTGIMEDILGANLTVEISNRSKNLYERAARHAWDKGIIIADTKFEWGESKTFGSTPCILIDEVLTPDSSRFWDVKDYCLGENPASFDKQYVRDYLHHIRWDKNSDPPELPSEVVKMTSQKYCEAYKRLTGKDL